MAYMGHRDARRAQHVSASRPLSLISAGLIGVLMAFALIAITGGSPALANEQSAAFEKKQQKEPEAAEWLTIPFDPPIGQALTYTLAIEKQRPNQETKSIQFDQQLKFEAYGDGFLLHITPQRVTVDGMTVDLLDLEQSALLPAAITPFFLPVTVELDSHGEMVRMHDWDKLRGALESLPDMVMDRLEEESRPGLEGAVKMVLAPILNASAQDAPAFLIEGWPQILGYGEVELERGEPFLAQTEMGGGMMGVPINAELAMTLNLNANGDYHLRQTSTPDPEAVKQATLNLLGRVLKQQGLSDAQINAEMGQTSMTMTDDLEAVFDRMTGLPQSATITRLISVNTPDEQSARGDIITITRQTP